MRGLLEAGSVDLWPLVTHRFTLDQWEDAIQVMNGGASGKVVMFVGKG
jgi:threonine 3-dehydrogenase